MPMATVFIKSCTCTAFVWYLLRAVMGMNNSMSIRSADVCVRAKSRIAIRGGFISTNARQGFEAMASFFF